MDARCARSCHIRLRLALGVRPTHRRRVIFDWLMGKRCTAVTAPEDNPANATIFEFGDAVFWVDTMWRISIAGRLHRTLGDDGQRYGLGHPIDVRADAAEVLAGRAIVSVSVDLVRGDIAMELDGKCVLEFLTESHYEAWQCTAPGHHYVAASSGEVMRVVEESPGRCRSVPVRGDA